MSRRLSVVSIAGLWLLQACSSGKVYDVVIRNGLVYDGSGSPPNTEDIGIAGDTIAFVGRREGARGRTEVDARGLAVAPGFINMLSWANESLIADGKSQSDIRQGVTLEVLGEGWSMGPLTDSMKQEMKAEEGDIRYDIPWSTLGEYLDFVANKGISANIASFVGATTVRIHEVGYADRPATPAELDRMRALVRQAMEEGALGVSSSLIYAPSFYAGTDELIELAKVAASYGGMYVSHIRSEGNRLFPAVQELITIARQAGCRAEFYHLKTAGQSNWWKEDSLLAIIEHARAQGIPVTADMYTYTAGGTGLNAVMPPWVQEGGLHAWIERLKDAQIRRRLIREMRTPSDTWENFLLASGSPRNVLLVGFKSDSLKYLTGKTLDEVARMWHTSPEEAAMDLVIRDGSEVSAIYFFMSEENVRKEIVLPWMSFGSDEASLAPEGVFLKSMPHPRAYGNVARLFAKYVRDEKLLTVEEAVRRLTSLPATNLRIERRGYLRPGYYADVVVFDPSRVQDPATYEHPRQYATGVPDVFVNGVQVLKDGVHTGALPGRVVRGPGWKGGR